MVRPIVGIFGEIQEIDFANIGPLPHHAVFGKYVESITDYSDLVPICIPAVGAGDCADSQEYVESWLGAVDGLLIPGSISNVNPEIYGGQWKEDAHKIDNARDGTTLPVIRHAIEKGIPILAICRGMQEMNVARGGTLYRRLHEIEGKNDHRSDKSLSFENRYRPSHHITIRDGGLLSRIVGDTQLNISEVRVNSLHEQGVDKIGNDVLIEAVAEDGTIEAISVQNGKSFCLGVQWHPEWYLTENPFNKAIFEAFFLACDSYAGEKWK